MQILTQDGWVAPENLHFYKFLGDAGAAGPWTTL